VAAWVDSGERGVAIKLFKGAVTSDASSFASFPAKFARAGDIVAAVFSETGSTARSVSKKYSAPLDSTIYSTLVGHPVSEQEIGQFNCVEYLA
jgi:hypothetical protein